jgi:flagellar biosynthetic protein FlhB
MRELLRQNIPRAIRSADVVVTNPTHYAVALEYNKELGDYPRVTAKGQDEIALHIRRIARENEVPVIENKPLARALYAEVELGEIITQDYKYFDAVLAIYQQVYELDRKTQTLVKKAAG